MCVCERVCACVSFLRKSKRIRDISLSFFLDTISYRTKLICIKQKTGISLFSSRCFLIRFCDFFFLSFFLSASIKKLTLKRFFFLLLIGVDSHKKSQKKFFFEKRQKLIRKNWFLNRLILRETENLSFAVIKKKFFFWKKSLDVFLELSFFSTETFFSDVGFHLKLKSCCLQNVSFRANSKSNFCLILHFKQSYAH